MIVKKMSWIDYTIQKPHRGNLIYAEYPDANALPMYELIIYNLAAECLGITRWKPVQQIPVMNAKYPAI
jgi:hypothetical protein